MRYISKNIYYDLPKSCPWPNLQKNPGLIKILRGHFSRKIGVHVFYFRPSSSWDSCWPFLTRIFFKLNWMTWRIRTNCKCIPKPFFIYLGSCLFWLRWKTLRSFSVLTFPFESNRFVIDTVRIKILSKLWDCTIVHW